eukprot:COSAG01_NODE_43893_length_424_cov_131.523077_1_plen_31_part_01
MTQIGNFPNINGVHYGSMAADGLDGWWMAGG